MRLIDVVAVQPVSIDEAVARALNNGLPFRMGFNLRHRICRLDYQHPRAVLFPVVTTQDGSLEPLNIDLQKVDLLSVGHIFPPKRGQCRELNLLHVGYEPIGDMFPCYGSIER